MPFEKELSYLIQNKESIIFLRNEILSKQFPDFYPYIGFEEATNQYFLFMTEFHIPAEIHLSLDWLFKWVTQHVKITMHHLLASAQSWMDAFMNFLFKYENTKTALECSHVLMSRQNIFLRLISEIYLQKSVEIIEEKDVKIDKLHNDRLSLIGKMASSMAHEIRNPLTSIAGFLKLIRRNILNGNQAQLLGYIDVIDDEFDLINMQIVGFLSFSKNGVAEEKYIEISSMQLVHETLALLYPRLLNDDINLVLHVECNCVIHVQKIPIQQVLSNIISNAIDALNTVHYQREIKIFCSQDEEYTYIHVVNNGPEIPNEMKNSLFLPFVTAKENGTGLGLAICKEIMIKNNGGIDFKSNADDTSFILSFSKQLMIF
jgi:two-component system, sporulation sensor kinase D